MRVLHYKPTMRAEEGGVVKAVFDMCVLTASERLQVGLMTHHTDLVRSSLPPEAVGLVELHSCSLPRFRFPGIHGRNELAHIARVIDAYDLVHLHSMWITSNPQIARICRQLGKPYVVTVHGMLDDWCMRQKRLKKHVYLKTWASNLLSHASRVHCTADAELVQARPWLRGAPGEVIPLPMDLSPFWRLPGPEHAIEAFPQIRRDMPRVLFLSRLHPKKGADRLIRASALLHARGMPHQLLIAGSGSESYTKKLRQLSKDEGIEAHTSFLGFVTGKLKVALFQTASVFALPTSQENFGFVLFESLAAGTPVVTTGETDTWPELERSGGAVIADNTAEAFASAIARLLSQPDHARSLGDHARQWVLRQYDRNRTANRYEGLYRDCSERSP
jgi:glycosyltransferase involved in cell wall biosynthesis